MSEPLNIAGFLDLHEVARARHPAIIHHDRTIPYGDFAKAVRRQSNQLLASGLRAGDLVGLCLNDTPEYLEILFGLARIGAVVLPMDVRWTPAEISRVVAHFRPEAILSGRDLGAEAGEARLLPVDDDWRGQVAARPDVAPIHLAAGAPLLVSLSSGTTGRPTGPLLRHDQMYARIVSQMASLGFSAYDRFLTATPLYFGGGRSFSVSQLVLGATLVLHCPPYKPEELAAVVARHRVTSLFLVPTILRRLLELPDAALKPFAPVRQLISSGSPLHPHEREAVRGRMTPNYYEYYASTEGGGISVLSPDAQDSHPASVGRQLFRVEVQLVDDDHVPLPHGRVGAVRYRGPGVADSFFRDSEAGQSAFRDGWFYPGDLGEMDGDGFLSLRGRKKDMILRGGVNIYPLEVEQVVSLMPEVSEACVFPLPHPQMGEEVALAFVAADSEPAAELEARIAAFCRDHLAPYKIPSRMFRLDALPRNSGGKVVRAQVIETVEAIR